MPPFNTHSSPSPSTLRSLLCGWLLLDSWKVHVSPDAPPNLVKPIVSLVMLIGSNSSRDLEIAVQIGIGKVGVTTGEATIVLCQVTWPVKIWWGLLRAQNGESLSLSPLLGAGSGFVICVS